MIDIETKEILRKFAGIAERYVVIQEKHYKLISDPGFVASEPKSSCCSVHAGTSEECKEECEHESEGKSYVKYDKEFRLETSGPNPGIERASKCKKCGEFYR